MAEIHNRKSTLYSQKQSVRDELSAPLYLESAGDDLIKSLAKNQTNTRTSLREQLEIVQNFRKGFDLNPDDRKGVTSLSDFKNHLLSQQESSGFSTEEEKITNSDGFAGLSRHKLELSLCEKPNSTISQLYMFAMANKKPTGEREAVEYKLPDHPMNHLREIEKEYFGSAKEEKTTLTDGKQKAKKKKKQRKRRKKTAKDSIPKELGFKSESLEKKTLQEEEKSENTSKPSRPSLWDVKDMKSWSEPKVIGCKPQAFYAIKNGKIIKLEKESGDVM